MKLLLPLMATASLLVPSLASAASCSDCKDLPRLEKELFEQEFLQQAFRQYANYEKNIPAKKGDETDVEALQRSVTADFNAWLHSPAGGGNRNAHGGAAWGTGRDCNLVIYLPGKNKDGSPKTAPFDDAAQKKFRADNCDAITDYLLAHEAVHQKSCKDALDIFDDPRIYAADDVRAYGAGIRSLRKYIRTLAESCGWEGSTSETKTDAAGNKEDVVPTMKRITSGKDALKNGKGGLK
ncbi:MAG TPA: hypothetical protein VMV18_12130 [bacterium]|nr:hypothetical protein [bacterium]